MSANKIRLFYLTIFQVALCCLLIGGSIWAQTSPDIKKRRDPFIPLVTHDGRLVRIDIQENAEGLQLEGVIYDQRGLSYAIVNGAVVKVGDIAGDYQVLKIQKNKVTFIKENQLFELEMKDEEGE